MSEKKITVTLDVLLPHPGQPPDRILNTTDLQRSILNEGLQKSIRVCSDGVTVIDGTRRWTALRRLVEEGHKRFDSTEVVVEAFDRDSEESYRYLSNANVQDPMTKTQLLHTAYALAQTQGTLGQDYAIYKAAVKLGVPKPTASLLDKVARYDAKMDGLLVEALRSYERTGKGLSWSAWKAGSGQTAAWWKDRIEKKRDLSLKGITADRKKAVRESAQIELTKPGSNGTGGDVTANKAITLAYNMTRWLPSIYDALKGVDDKAEGEDLVRALRPVLGQVEELSALWMKQGEKFLGSKGMATLVAKEEDSNESAK